MAEMTLPTSPAKLRTVLRGWLNLNAEVCCVVRAHLECRTVIDAERRLQDTAGQFEQCGGTPTLPCCPRKPDELTLYRTMYAFLSTLRECRCQWSIEQVLERLVEDMLRSWVCTLCEASGRRLTCPSCSADKVAEQANHGFGATLASRCGALVTDGKADSLCETSVPNYITCVQSAYAAQDDVWREVRAEARSQWRTLLSSSLTCPAATAGDATSDGQRALPPRRRGRSALRTVGALSRHYRLMKHVLRFVLLRAEEMRGMTGLLARVLHRVMRELLQQNSVLVLNALIYSAEVIISVAPETGGGSWADAEGQSSDVSDQPSLASCRVTCSTLDSPTAVTPDAEHARGVTDCAALAAIQLSVEAVDCDEVAAVHMLLEDCGLSALQARNDAVVQQECARLGHCVVRAVLDELSATTDAVAAKSEGGSEDCHCCHLNVCEQREACKTTADATSPSGAANADQDGAACEGDVGQLPVIEGIRPTLVALRPARPSEVEANKALREVMQHYVRLRSSLLRYYAGATQVMDKVSVAIQGRVVHALHAFFAGLAEGDILGRFITRWAVPLWLQLCEETLRRQTQEQARQNGLVDGGLPMSAHAVGELAVRRRTRDMCLHEPVKEAGLNLHLTAAVDVASSSSAALSRSFRDARSEPARSQRQGHARRHGLVDAALAGADETETHALRARLQVHYMAHLPPEGFPTLLYLLPAAEAERRALLARFSDGVRAHLVTLLRREQKSAPIGRTDATVALRVLPTAVFERCIFALKMTYAAFGSEIERVTRMRVDCELDDDDEDRENGGHAAEDTGVATMGDAGDGEMEECDGLYVFHTPWDRHKDKADLLQRRRRCYLTATEEALVAVRRGLQAFFADYEALVIPTIAGALHAQTLLVPPSRPHGAAVLDVVDTLLDLATLLPSKDIFVTYYERLLASHLLTVTEQSPRRRHTDTRVVHADANTKDSDQEGDDVGGLALLSEVLYRMARRLGRTVTSRCLSLLRDVARALREEQADYLALLLAPRGGRRRAGSRARARRRTPDDNDGASLSDVPPHQPASPSSSMSYPAALLQRAANLLRPASGRATARSTTGASESASSALGQASPSVAVAGSLTTTTGAWGWWQSPRLEAARAPHIVTPYTRRPLLTGVRVLCRAWWEPYSAVVVSSAALRTMCVEQGWWQDRLVDAVLRVEWCYAGRDLADFDGFASCRTASSLRHRWLAQRNRHAMRQSQRRPDSDLRASLAAFSQSTSLVVQSVSSVLSSAMQQSGNRHYDNLRATEHHSGSLGNAAFDAVDAHDDEYSDLPALTPLELQSTSNHQTTTGAGTLTNAQPGSATLGTPAATTASTTSATSAQLRSVGDGGGARASSSPAAVAANQDETNAITPATPQGAPMTTTGVALRHERRRLVWPLCSGELTIVVHPKYVAGHTATGLARRNSVQVTGPPLTLVLLQLLDRHTLYAFDAAATQAAASENAAVGFTSPCTMAFIQAHLPVQVPLRVLTTLVTTLVRMGIVQRVKDATTGQTSYGLPCAFGHLTQRKVLVRPRRPPHTWHELSAVNDRAMASLDLTAATETKDERGSTTIAAEAADLQRMFFAARARKVQVCIVREMKTQLSLSHTELFSRVASVLQEQFVLTTALFKQAVARLVERGFLERRGDNEGYSYIT